MRACMVMLIAVVVTLVGQALIHAETATSIKPNFIIILTDDQGYNDLGCYGSPDIRTPRLDQMAKNGIRFTSFYAQTVCGPSRTALMTGCYPLRVATYHNTVETHPILHSKEITIAEILKTKGYKTASFGKWDLAKHSQTKYIPELLPLQQGFDYFFGTPTSNDSVVRLIRNNEVIEQKADMSLLTQRYTDEAINFMKEAKGQPFFMYLAHSMPHLRLAASPAFKGKSSRGLYGDVIEEIDFNMGRLIDAVASEGLINSTYIIYVSDNGPWYIERHKMLSKQHDAGGSHGGSAVPLRGAKTSVWEGGVRVPCIIQPPPGTPTNLVCDSIASTMDLLPTIAALAGAEMPTDRVIDGENITALIQGDFKAVKENRTFLYYQQTSLQAVRVGKWKLHHFRPGPENWDIYSRLEDINKGPDYLLYDVSTDIAEQNNVADQHPDIVRTLQTVMENARHDIGDKDVIGKKARFFDNQPKRPDIK